MSWDKKARGRKGGYYYRSVRVGSRVVKQYVGAGPAAEMAAALDMAERRRRHAEREAWRDELSRISAADLVLDDVGVLCNLLATAVLAALGYHHHRGEWRRRRERAGKRAILCRRSYRGSGASHAR